jgi:hypothetical protein
LETTSGAHAVWPAIEQAHVPSVHVEAAPTHRLPQAPQFDESKPTSTQVPLQLVSAPHEDARSGVMPPSLKLAAPLELRSG